MHRRTLLAATAVLMLNGPVMAESVVRYGISLADIPLTTGQPDRGAGKPQTQRVEDLTIELVESDRVDPEELEPLLCSRACDRPITSDLCDISYPPQQAVGDPRCPSGAFGNRSRPLGVDRHLQECA